MLTPRFDGRGPGTPAQATARDLAALRFVGEHYAARSDVLAAVLGRLSPAAPRKVGRLGHTVRQRVERWEAAGWAVRRRMLDHTWVLPTRAGLRLAGLDFDPWTPALDRLAHHHAVAVVRLAREPIPAKAAGSASGSCGAAAARPAGTWPMAPSPARSQPTGRASTRRGSWSRSS